MAVALFVWLIHCTIGGCTWAYHGMYQFYTRFVNNTYRPGDKAFVYLADLEHSGVIDGGVYDGLGDCYRRGIGCKQDPYLALMYYQRALDLGFPLGLLVSDHSRWTCCEHVAHDKGTLMLMALQAEEKGIKDDRIIDNLITRLIVSIVLPLPTTLGKFRIECASVFGYCDILIERKSPRGYDQKGQLYYWGSRVGPAEKAKGLAIWEEADRLELAGWTVYARLLEAYK